MARSIFLERILRSFVGSIDNILNDLKTSVEGIVDDIGTIDGQLDRVQDKMGEVIVAFGQGTKSVMFSHLDPNNHIKVNNSDIICDVNNYLIGVASLVSKGDGYIGVRIIYNESVNAADTAPPATKKSTITATLTRAGGTTEVIDIGTTTGVASSGTPQQGKEITKAFQTAYNDTIQFTVNNGSQVSGNTVPATITGIFIDYSLVSVTEPGGAFVRIA